jgi:hypothetical protein
MILSVSRRTDIPALYGDWFLERVRDGFTLCANPFFPCERVAKIKIEPVRVHKNPLGGYEVTGNVDGIIFWTKNPRPMMARLPELKDFVYYFHFTLNPYDATIEKNVPPLDERVKTFQDLSALIGAERVVWRYDPILLSPHISVDWHLTQFEKLCTALNGYTKCCHTSFLIGRHKDFRMPNDGEQHTIMREFAKVARANGITILACAQKADWSAYGVGASRCTDPELFLKLTGAKRVKTKRLDGQRKHCGCMPCVDIGVYNTCTHGCLYCYANGFYAYRGEPKSMLDKPIGNEYDRITERIFEY